MTGFRVSPLYIQETDGPIGVASLARAIDIALEGKPIIITEPIDQSLRISNAIYRGVGLNAISLKDFIKKPYKHTVSVIGFTMDKKNQKMMQKNIR